MSDKKSELRRSFYETEQYGVNLLGGFITAAGLLATGWVENRTQAEFLPYVVGGLVAAALDLAYRAAVHRADGGKRFLRTDCGGCVVYAPAWLLVPIAFSLLGWVLAGASSG